MYTGRMFRLAKSIFAVESVEGNRTAVEIPAGVILEVSSGPTPTDQRMVDTIWDGRHLVIFAVDLEERGVVVKPGG